MSREPGRPLTANSLAAAPDGEEADAGNEDDGAADHERSPGLGCRPQRHNNTKEAWRAGNENFSWRSTKQGFLLQNATTQMDGRKELPLTRKDALAGR